MVEAAGGTIQDLVKVTTYLTDLRYREELARIRAEFSRTASYRPQPDRRRWPRRSRYAGGNRSRRGAPGDVDGLGREDRIILPYDQCGRCAMGAHAGIGRS